MDSVIFERETILDISVNLIPLGILAFFLVAFVAFNPWGGAPLLARVLQFSIVGVTFLSLAYLTYEAAVRIEGEESEDEDEADH